MTKAELVAKVADSVGISKMAAGKAIKRKADIGRNPRTGDEIEIPTMRVRPSGIVKPLAVIVLVIIAGLMLSGWAWDPTVNNPIATRADNEQYPAAVRDADGAVFIGWMTTPSAETTQIQQLYVQKLRAIGNPQWVGNGLPASPLMHIHSGSTGSQSSFVLVPDNLGGVYVVWYADGMDFNGDGDLDETGEIFGNKYRLYAQWLNGNGAPTWSAPVLVSDQEIDLPYRFAAVLALLGSDTNLIVAWVGGMRVVNNDGSTQLGGVTAQRLDQSGTRLWGDNAGANGKSIFDYPDVSGGGRVPYDTSPIGLVYDGTASNSDPRVIVAWAFTPAGSATSELRGVAINRADGARSNGKLTSDPGFLLGETIYAGRDFRMVPDRAGGAVLAWQGCACADVADPNCHGLDIYAQRVVVTQRGGLRALWGSRVPGQGWNALPVSTAFGDQGGLGDAVPRGLDVVTVGRSGVIVVWEDYEPSADFNKIYAQKISGGGGVLWGVGGVQVSANVAPGQTQTAPRVVPDGGGGALVAWVLDQNGKDIYAQRLDKNTGAPVWVATDTAVSTAIDDQDWPVMTSNACFGAIVAWMDTRNYGFPLNHYNDIYAQGIRRDGSLGVDFSCYSAPPYP